MRAVIAPEPGGPDALQVVELDDPEAGPGEVLVRVAATAVNRADTLQRQGHYSPPPGATEVLGLECSGTVAALGEGVTGWSVGDEVCALLAGGGYAELVAVPAGQLMPVPDGLDLVQAGSLPEVACTVWSNVFMIAGLQPGERLLVHGGAGGREDGRTEGRLVVIGLQGGTKGELDLGMLLRKRGAVIATTLRARPPAEKAAITAAVAEHVWPLVADGRVRPVVHTALPLDRVSEAHRLMDESGHIGKIVLTV